MRCGLGARAAVVLIGLVLLGGCAGDKSVDSSSAVAATAADNGIARLRPGELLERVAAAMRSAGSMQVTDVRRLDSGEKWTSRYWLTDRGASGRVETPGGEFEFVAPQGNLGYIRCETCWAIFPFAPGEADELAGKWVRVDRAFLDRWAIDVEFDLRTQFDASWSESHDRGFGGANLVQGKPKQVDGTKALSVTDTNRSPTKSLWIAAVGEPYLLAETHSDGVDTRTYSRFGKPMRVEAPPAGQIVDLPELVGPLPYG
jgi:hypothetical protein